MRKLFYHITPKAINNSGLHKIICQVEGVKQFIMLMLKKAWDTHLYYVLMVSFEMVEVKNIQDLQAMLYDCIKCWSTPCQCGYEYSGMSIDELAAFIAAIISYKAVEAKLEILDKTKNIIEQEEK